MARYDGEFEFDLCFHGTDYGIAGDFTAYLRNDEIEDVLITFISLYGCDGDVIYQSSREAPNYEKTTEGFVYDYARHLIIKEMHDKIVEGSK